MTQIDSTTDKSGKVIKGTVTMTSPVSDPNNIGGQKIVKQETVDGKVTSLTDTIVSGKGDSFKTTNLDPQTGIKTSEVTTRASGSTTTTTYDGCKEDGTGAN